MAVDVTSCHYKQIRGDGENIVCMEMTETVFKGTLTPIMWVVWLCKELQIVIYINIDNEQQSQYQQP